MATAKKAVKKAVAKKAVKKAAKKPAAKKAAKKPASKAKKAAVAAGIGGAAVETFKHEPLIEEMDDFGDEVVEDLDEEEGAVKADGWEDAEEKEDAPFEKLEDDDEDDTEEDEIDGDDEGYF